MTLDIKKLRQLLAMQGNLQGLSDAQVAALPGFSAPLLTPKPYFVDHRKMLDVCCSIAGASGIAIAEWVAGVLKAQLPTTYQIYVTVGPSDGTGGGLDVSNPATIGFVNQLVGVAAAQTPPVGFAQAIADAVIALGQTSSYEAGGPVQTADVTTARALNAQAAAVLAKVQAIQQGAAAALTLVNQYANGPVTGTMPSNAQLIAAMTAAIGS